MMRAPKFWLNNRGQPGFLSNLLQPLARLWAKTGRNKMRKGARERLAKPTICIGNINVGGTGKTPVTVALQSLLKDIGANAHIVSRGYGGIETGPLKVHEKSHTANQVGDEPVLMSAFGDVWVAKNRADGANAAIEDGADVVLFDDGFQNFSVKYDLSILVVDAAIGFGNGRVLPAGPLRENLSDGLARADILITIGQKAAQQQLLANWPELSKLPRISAELAPLQTGMDWQGLRCIAFAGIGRPAKFFETLRGLGATLVDTHEFADHTPYSDKMLNRLKAESQKAKAQLVTTEKDAVRLPQYFRCEVLSLPVRLEMDDDQPLRKMLEVLLK